MAAAAGGAGSGSRDTRRCIVAEEEKKQKNIDIWLVLVIILMVLSIGGGLWITGQLVLSRLDAMDVVMRGQGQRIETEQFSQRKQIQELEFSLKKVSNELKRIAPPATTPQTTTPDK